MRKLSSKLARQQSGFTLIELVIVIVIIGILAAVAIPNFSSVTDDAQRGLADGLVGNINSALAAEKALCAVPNRTCTSPTTLAGITVATYVPTLPGDSSATATVNATGHVIYTPKTGATAVTSSATVSCKLLATAC